MLLASMLSNEAPAQTEKSDKVHFMGFGPRRVKKRGSDQESRNYEFPQVPVIPLDAS